MMKPAKIIIVMQKKDSIRQIQQLLFKSGHQVIHSCQAGNEALLATRSMMPDMVIVNETLSDYQGMDLAQIMIQDQLCGVILLASPAQKAYVEKKMESADFICLSKPIQGVLLEHSVEMLHRTLHHIRKLEQTVIKMKTKMDNRKLIEKAKGLIMEKLEMTETLAYREIQKKSMDTGKNMAEVAEAIICMFQQEETEK